MRPEPGNRISRAEKRKAWNESPPVCIRIASHPVKEELDARSDGTLAGYRQVIVRDLERYYRIIAGELAERQMEMLHAKCLYDDWQAKFYPMTHLSQIDALERARILVDAGLSLDEALVSVGLVKGETE